MKMDSFIAWIGGKRLLRNKITELFPTDITRYIEVFGGAGWVLFHKEKHAEMEVYNDICGNLVNLFRCVKFHTDELQKELTWCLNSREIFFDYKDQLNNRGLTDIQRAAMYFIQIKTSYGADRRSYGCVKKTLSNSIQHLTEIHKRLEKVIIKNKDFEGLVKTYDREKALFYLDPPYHKTEKYYDNFFNESDHFRLNSCLKTIKGRFILSYNDDEFIRELYKDFNINGVTRQNNLLERHPDIDKDFKELIITNFR